LKQVRTLRQQLILREIRYHCRCVVKIQKNENRLKGGFIQNATAVAALV